MPTREWVKAVAWIAGIIALVSVGLFWAIGGFSSCCTRPEPGYPIETPSAERSVVPSSTTLSATTIATAPHASTLPRRPFT